ncbi:hypothetical protein MVEN_01821200 [Mycena venus]|uniref:Uncharacterized protein n=1 Tax=Mycena venus TaxID=2733690 RepID=A0A8H7CP22_9AGAR|nr:hypothetical protein MVEN_01821200 [Mycena venus]
MSPPRANGTIRTSAGPPSRASSSSPDLASYRTIYTSPPPVKTPYRASEALSDLPGVSYALDQFLASRMHESEDYMNASDAKKERLYFATGYGLIQCVKGLMSYADEDLLAAIGHCKQGVLIASQHRKKAPYLASRLAGYVVSSLNTTGVGFVRTMTDIERHAELVYAESLFEKALLGIVYSGDWLAFIKEALNMRTIITIYRTLYKYVQAVDAEYAAEQAASSPSSPVNGVNGETKKNERIESPAIDAHFRSGVYLGAGMSTLILSLLPARLLNIIELFGYAADRAEALEILGRAGGWGSSEATGEPSIPTSDEGVRRAICDMALLIFHLILSSFTFDGVDTRMAGRVVEWNLKRYPGGVFFLFGAGRLALMRSQPERAIEYYTKAMVAQTQYRNLHHISFWEMAIAYLALADVDKSLECWRTLEGEATWSKSIYSYGMAVCLLESTAGNEADRKKRVEEARKLMERVPTLRQKIAGKSIPLEKFVARKARKFLAQDNRLALPALEISYVFLGIAHAPRKIVEESMLPAVRGLLASLGHGSAASEKEEGVGKDKEKDLKEREKAQGYWDDYCLARFLEGVCLRYVAFPDPDAVLDATEVPNLSRDEAAAGAKAAFEAVFEHGPKIELDHHLVYHAHYELGRLTACLGDEAEARRHFDLVLSGKYLEVGPSGRKVGKYSMENALHMRTQAAVEALHQERL